MSWLWSPPGSQRAPLAVYCFPFAGGDASAFRPWAAALSPHVAVRAVTLPGRGARFTEPAMTGMAEVCDRIAAVIAADTEQDFVLAGHSMGSLLGFEVARRLTAAGRAPVRLVAGATVAPRNFVPRLRSGELDPDRLAAFLEETGGTPAEAIGNPALMGLLLPIVRADFELLESYRYAHSDGLGCPITAIRCLDDESVPEDLHADWAKETRGEVTLVTVPGNHMATMDDPAPYLGAIRAEAGVRTPTPVQARPKPDIKDTKETVWASGKRAELFQRLAGQTRPDVPTPLDRTPGQRLPLSFAQHRMWLMDQVLPGSGVYNIPIAMRLRGDLDVDALARALDDVERRHEALRARFPTESGAPVQVIDPAPARRLEVLDVPPQDVEAVVAKHAAEGFSLATGPLWRTLLIRAGDGDWVLLLTIHHIAADGWSMGVLLRELSTSYTGGTLPALPVQYPDFAAWQRKQLAGPVLEQQVSYWRKQIEGAPPVLALPSDRARPARPTYAGGSYEFTLPAGLARKVEQFAREHGVTQFVVLLAAFKALLHRYTGVTDVVVGTPVANRNRPEIEHLIGFFVNTLVLRTDVAGDPAFTELVDRVRATSLGAYDHQDLPFEYLVEQLRPERDLSHHPLVQVVFAWQNQDMPDLSLPGTTVRHMPADSGTSRFDLFVSLRPRTDGTVGGLVEFSRDLFDDSTVTRLVRHFEVLLDSAVAAPRQRLSQVRMLDDDEIGRVDVDFGAGGVCLHEMFRKQAAAAPDAPAVITPDKTWSYRQVYGASGRVAQWLGEQGVRRGELVGVAMDKGAEQVAAVLGVLAAGAAYVPLDPSLPGQRFAELARIAEVRFIVTQPWLAERQWPQGVRLCTDFEPAEWPQVASDPDDLAYVIFTSGSTGVPKGVMIPHRGAANTILDINERFEVGPADRVLGVSALSFDLSVYDIFGPLAVGGAVVLPSEQGKADPAHWAALVAEHGVTFWDSVPMLLQLAVERGGGDLSSLRVALLSGDWIPLSLPGLVWRSVPGLRLHSGGGATEASIWSILYPITSVDPAWSSIPYGRPMTNQTFYVLDPAGRPCPVGVAGELHIGGVGVALGYWRDEERTKAQFLTDPYTGQRMYRTGDRGRWRPDGTIEFLGRVDDQVKVRGFRVELGEVETVLRTHPGVSAAAVNLHDDGKLVAYVVTANGVLGDMRTYVRDRLPDYMVPAMFVPLNALPLSTNGKVDRRALPAPEPQRPDLGVDFAAASNATEQLLAGIWRQVLSVDQVGIDDNFFDLGGNSLLLTQVRYELGERGHDVPMVVLFEHPTVRTAARHLDRAEAKAAPTSDRDQGRARAAQARALRKGAGR